MMERPLLFGKEGFSAYDFNASLRDGRHPISHVASIPALGQKD
jgi:hypothetical protein